jgi:hypothetical protein
LGQPDPTGSDRPEPLSFQPSTICGASSKAKIPFVQGRFNCGGTGVLPFSGDQSYKLIVSRRYPEIPSDPTRPGVSDSSHHLWGFTLIRMLPASAGVFDTMVYVYLAPGGRVPSFQALELQVLPQVSKEAVAQESEEENGEEQGTSFNKLPKPYQLGLSYGTVVKLYDYRWKARSLATQDVRFELERYLYKLSLPIRIIETRQGYRANYYATSLAGTYVTISKDEEKGYLEPNFPIGGEIQPVEVGKLPVTIVLYRERLQSDDKQQENGEQKPRAKAAKRLPKGVYFTINGQVHYSIGPEFFVTRGLNYEFLKDTLLVTVDCTGMPQDIRDKLIMPSRDRLRKLPAFESILESIIGDLKDRDLLRSINDERKLRRVKDALKEEGVQDVFQSLINKDPVFASLFREGKGLRSPILPGRDIYNEPYNGKKPPTFFHFHGGKREIAKSFAIDRTCTVELETDAVNGYFEMANPIERGQLLIEPGCFERWHLLNGRLRITFRAPSNARIGDTIKVRISIIDPILYTGQGEPTWVNHVTLTFTEGGKEVKSGTNGERKPRGGGGSLGLPEVVEVYRKNWPDHAFGERSGIRITKNTDGSYLFFVNMDNTYLHNEMMRRKDADKEAAKFAFKWGLVLISLGMLEELKKNSAETKQEIEDDAPQEKPSAETEVSRFSAGVAAVIIPTVLNLMDVMNSSKGE